MSLEEECDYQSVVLADNPIAYWRLGDTTGTTAANIGSLGAAVDGTYQNGVTLGSTGLVANDPDTAASFDGFDDYVSIPSNSEINTGGPFTARTIELWFKASAFGGRQILYEQGGAHNGFNIYLDDNRLWVGVWANDAGNWVSTPGALDLDTAYHVALVYDGSGAQTVTGYLDGAVLGSTSAVASVPGHVGLIGIGRIDDETFYAPDIPITDLYGDEFSGVIDEVAIYNAVLSPERILAHVEGCGTPTCYELTLSHTGEGADPVAFPDRSDGCAVGFYHYNEYIEFSGADPDTGWEIGGWTGTDNDGSTAATNTLSMPADAHTVSVDYVATTCYELTLSHTGEGADPVASPDRSDGCAAGYYHYQEDISLTADSDTGWTVTGWTGTDNDGSTADTNTLTMPADDHAASVDYYHVCYQLTLSHIGDGADPVASPDRSDGCATGYYHYQEDISLTADPDTGWAVSGWTGTDNDGSTAATNTLSMPADDHAAGVDYYHVCYELTLTHTGMGADPEAFPGRSDGCSAGFYHYQEDIYLVRADPDTGWEIGGWSGTDNDSSTSATNTLSMPANDHAASVDYYHVCYELTLSRTGMGDDPVASPTHSDGCNVGYYYYQEDISLTADPDTGWAVSGWTGTDNDGSTAATNTLSMPADDHAASVNYYQVCYELTLSHTGEGADPVAFPDRSDGCAVGFYHYNEYIELSGADPDTGWEIGGWTGTDNDGSIAATNTLSMPADDHAASVDYYHICYELTLTHTGMGADPVATPTSSDGCAVGYYHYDEDISLTADPDPGWAVTGWTGTDNDVSTAESNTLTMPADGHAASVDYYHVCYELTLTHTGMGADPEAFPGRSDGCAVGYYHYQEAIDFSGADPDTGWEVGGWTGTDNDSSTAATNTLSMPAGAHTVSTDYVATCYQFTLSHTGMGADPVATPTSSDGCAVGYYHYDDDISLTADPDTGWAVSGWTGTDNDSSTAATNTLSMPADDHAASVIYEAIPQYILTVTPSDYGTVELEPAGGTYYDGTVVTLFPDADLNWSFIDWVGPDAADVVDNGNGTWSITMDSDKEITPRFMTRIFVPIMFRNTLP